jgi:hypothetical protein
MGRRDIRAGPMPTSALRLGTLLLPKRRPQLRQQILSRHKRQRHRRAPQGALIKTQEHIEFGQGGRQVVGVRACVVIEPVADGLGEGSLAEQVFLPLGFFLGGGEPARLPFCAVLKAKK